MLKKCIILIRMVNEKNELMIGLVFSDCSNCYFFGRDFTIIIINQLILAKNIIMILYNLNTFYFIYLVR